MASKRFFSYVTEEVKIYVKYCTLLCVVYDTQEPMTSRCWWFVFLAWKVCYKNLIVILLDQIYMQFITGICLQQQLYCSLMTPVLQQFITGICLQQQLYCSLLTPVLQIIQLYENQFRQLKCNARYIPSTCAYDCVLCDNVLNFTLNCSVSLIHL